MCFSLSDLLHSVWQPLGLFTPLQMGPFHPFLWLSNIPFYSSVQSLSHVRLFATPWITVHQASLSITNSRSLLKLMSVESVMPSNHLILYHPLLLLPPICPSIRVSSSESALRMRWPKYWNFSFSWTQLFIHASVDGRWGCFRVLTLVSSAAVNMGVRVAFQTMFFFWYILPHLALTYLPSPLVTTSLFTISVCLFCYIHWFVLLC